MSGIENLIAADDLLSRTAELEEPVLALYLLGFKERPTWVNRGVGSEANTVTTSTKHKCADCEYTTTRMSQLRDHMLVHTGERAFQCGDCVKVFRRKEDLKRHEDNVHKKIKTSQCSVCGRWFGRADHMKKHMKTHEK